MRHGSVGFYLLLAGMLCASSAAAQTAQTSSQQDKAVAVALAERGWEHYEAHRYTEALRAFREAEAKTHAPAFLLMMARCHVKLGRLLDARAAYQLVVNEKIATGVPPEFIEAKTDAKKELAALEPRIPTVEVVLTGAALQALDITLDEELVSLSGPVQRDPGRHTLVVRVPRRTPLTRVIFLVEGARERVEINEAEVDALPLVAAPHADAGQNFHLDDKKNGRSGGGPHGAAISHEAALPRTAVLIGGGAAAGLGIATGVVLTLIANERASDAEKLRHELIAQGDGFAICPNIDPSKCAELKSTVLTKVELTNSAFWSFVAAGAIGASTLIYGIATSGTPTTISGVKVAPLWQENATGLSLSGTF
ncbi:tetratricopeptide repeat protein (plasmid) [Sorangium sp. So ce119]|uniref:tetratricopeptide repeat protein n=1 Tax=Sorangium sp. So ce119 TaxID=3133279 RepID=UPI003F643A67